jgi:hypothetical protein
MFCTRHPEAELVLCRNRVTANRGVRRFVCSQNDPECRPQPVSGPLVCVRDCYISSSPRSLAYRRDLAGAARERPLPPSVDAPGYPPAMQDVNGFLGSRMAPPPRVRLRTWIGQDHSLKLLRARGGRVIPTLTSQRVRGARVLTAWQQAKAGTGRELPTQTRENFAVPRLTSLECERTPRPLS